MAEAIVSFVVERVGDLLIQEAIFLGGVKGQVEHMQIELKQMQRFLKDADKRQHEQELVKGMISDIREVAYDVEDVIETFALEVTSRSQPGFKNKCKRYAGIFIEGAKLHKVGKEIEALTTKITDLTENLKKYCMSTKEGEGSISTFERLRELRRSFSFRVEEYTVGMERNTEILVAQLLTEEKQCQVVSICGMGGLGKTTLAKKVYHHDEVRRHFDDFAWACITQQFQPRDIWEGILIKLVNPSASRREEISKWRDAEIVTELREQQQKKKFLVILDDIWTVDAWKALEPAFPIENACGKIVLTTRNKGLALEINPRGILEPLCLTEDESWELLQNKVLPKNDCTDFKIGSDMEELGRKMVGKCAGLPLAINVLGGLLASKHSFEEWKMTHEQMDIHLGRGKGHQEKQSYGVQGILALSYHELSYEMKPCFLYLSHFREDFEIPTKELIQLWVAEGFVPQVKKKTREDVAEFFLQELINRCMIQVGKRGSTGRIKTCCVHDLMRELCLSVANDENFFEIVDHDEIEQAVSPRVRRLVAYVDYGSVYRIDHARTSKLRSLLLLPDMYERAVSVCCDNVITTFKCFKLLRILILKNCIFGGGRNGRNGRKLIKEIGYLENLRYLYIFTVVDSITLPSSIGNLRYLQSLVLRAYEGIKLPNVIWKLEQLGHFRLEGWVGSTSGELLHLGNLKNLQTLQGIDTKVFDVNELAKFTNLKRLNIYCSGGFTDLEVILQVPGFFNQLRSLQFTICDGSIMEEIDLRRLFSSCHDLDKLSIEGPIKKLPEHHHFPPNLTKFTLTGSRLEEDPMATLEKLPNLKVLHLYNNVIQGNELVCSSKGFAQLKTLVIQEFRSSPNKLEEWRVEEEAMPNLCEICIKGCRNLKMLPDGLRFIKTLRELKIKSMPLSFRRRLKVADGEGEGGEDLYKVQHVPSILISDDDYYNFDLDFL